MQKQKSRSAYRRHRSRCRKRLFADYENNATQNASNVDSRWVGLLKSLETLFGGSLENVNPEYYGITKPKPKNTVRQRATSASIVHDYREIITSDNGYFVPNPNRGKAYRPLPTKQPNLKNQQNRQFWVKSVGSVDYVVCDMSEYDIESIGLDAYFERIRFDDFSGHVWATERSTLDVEQLRQTIFNACLLDETTDSRNIVRSITEKLPQI